MTGAAFEFHSHVMTSSDEVRTWLHALLVDKPTIVDYDRRLLHRV